MTHERWPALMTLAQAANYLQVGETVIKQLRAAGELSSVKIRDKIIRFRRVHLDKWIEGLPVGMGERITGGHR